MNESPNQPDGAGTGAGVLIVWTDIPPEIEADFNDWYNREHLPDRILRMPGFVRGRRYVSVSRNASAGAPKYLTYYDLQDTTFMLSDAHSALRRQRPVRDRWFVPKFINTIKGICDVVGRAGEGDGGTLVLLPVAAAPGHEQHFSRHVCGEWLPRLAAARGTATVTFARRNAAVTLASSARDDRAGDRYAEALIAVECTGEEGVASALALLHEHVLTQAGGRTHLLTAPCVLRLMVSLQAPMGKVQGGTQT
jgi:hypothetical protein